MKGYKLWDSVKRTVVVNRDVILDEKLMLKQSDMAVVPDIDVRNSSQDKIEVDIKEPPLSQRQIVARMNQAQI